MSMYNEVERVDLHLSNIWLFWQKSQHFMTMKNEKWKDLSIDFYDYDICSGMFKYALHNFHDNPFSEYVAEISESDNGLKMETWKLGMLIY